MNWWDLSLEFLPMAWLTEGFIPVSHETDSWDMGQSHLL